MKELEKDPSFEIAFVLHDVTDALRSIENADPDVLIVSYEMKGLSGIEIVKDYRRTHPGSVRPHVIMTSNFVSASFAGYISSFGVNDYIHKPYRIEEMMDRLSYLHRHVRSQDRTGCKSDLCSSGSRSDSYVRETAGTVRFRDEGAVLSGICYELLNNAGFSSDTKGFSHIIEAVKILHRADDKNMSVTKELYPRIAAGAMSNPATVERNIRRAIANAWIRNSSGGTAKAGGVDVFSSFRKRPGNGEFINKLLYYATMLYESGM